MPATAPTLARRRAWIDLLLVAGCFLVAVLAAGIAQRPFDRHGGALHAVPLLVAQTVLVVVAIPLFWALLRWRGKRFEDLGLRLHADDWSNTLALGGAHALWIKLATIPLGAVAYLCGARPGEVKLESGFLVLPALVYVGTLAAIVEEITFRGLLRDIVARLFGETFATARLWTTGLVTSVLFGLGHGWEGTLGMAVTTFTGLMLFVVTRLPRHDLRHAIVAHAVFNAIAFVLLGVLTR